MLMSVPFSAHGCLYAHYTVRNASAALDIGQKQVKPPGAFVTPKRDPLKTPELGKHILQFPGGLKRELLVRHCLTEVGIIRTNAMTSLAEFQAL